MRARTEPHHMTVAPFTVTPYRMPTHTRKRVIRRLQEQVDICLKEPPSPERDSVVGRLRSKITELMSE